jgi:hypothetical protein
LPLEVIWEMQWKRSGALHARSANQSNLGWYQINIAESTMHIVQKKNNTLWISVVIFAFFSLFFVQVASAHGLSDVIGQLTFDPPDAKPGELVKVTVQLKETAGAEGRVDLVNVELDLKLSVPDGEEIEKPLLPSGPAMFSETFKIGKGFHDVRVNLHRLDDGEKYTAYLGFTVNSTLVPLVGSDQEVWFSPAGVWPYFRILDNIAAALIAAIGLALILILYRKPVSLENSSSLNGSVVILFLLASAMAMIGFGGYWDVSWHSESFRETIFTPTHIMLVLGIVLLQIAAFSLLLKGKKSSWIEHIRQNKSAKIAVFILLIPLIGGPLDEIWHTQFGTDASLWAPPHIIIVFGGVTAALLMVAMNVEQDTTMVKLFRVLILGGTLFTAAIFLTEHEFPFPSWHASSFRPFFVYPGFLAIFTLVVSLMAKRVIDFRFSATLAVATFLAYRLLVYPLLAAVSMEITPRFPVVLVGTLIIAVLVDVFVKGPAEHQTRLAEVDPE